MASKGFRGYPIATLAFYGPDNKRASKVAVGIVAAQDQEPVALERWFSDVTDVREDQRIQAGPAGRDPRERGSRPLNSHR